MGRMIQLSVEEANDLLDALKYAKYDMEQQVYSREEHGVDSGYEEEMIKEMRGYITTMREAIIRLHDRVKEARLTSDEDSE